MTYLALILAIIAAPACAGTRCQAVGNMTYCTGDNAQTCQRVGNQTYCH